MVIVSAPGKIVLFGEHAVVYDKVGVAAAIGNRAYAKCELCERDITINAQDYSIKETINYDELMQLLRNVEKLCEAKDFAALKSLTKNSPLNTLKAVTAKAMQCANYLGGLNISVRSEIPKASGFGSGSAIFATIAGSILAACNKLDNKTVSNITYLGDIICHSTPSEIDNNAITYGGFIRFRRSEGIIPIKSKNNLEVVIGDTGIPAPTGDMAAVVRKKREEDSLNVNKIVDEIDKISQDAALAIEKGNLKEIGKLMDKNQELLSELGVSCPQLDKLIIAARKAGALGAKLAGAGGGGIMYAVFESNKDKEAIAQAITKAGGTPIITTLGAEGVKIESE